MTYGRIISVVAAAALVTMSISTDAFAFRGGGGRGVHGGYHGGVHRGGAYRVGGYHGGYRGGVYRGGGYGYRRGYGYGAAAVGAAAVGAAAVGAAVAAPRCGYYPYPACY